MSFSWATSSILRAFRCFADVSVNLSNAAWLACPGMEYPIINSSSLLVFIVFVDVCKLFGESLIVVLTQVGVSQLPLVCDSSCVRYVLITFWSSFGSVARNCISGSSSGMLMNFIESFHRNVFFRLFVSSCIVKFNAFLILVSSDKAIAISGKACVVAFMHLFASDIDSCYCLCFGIIF